MSLRIFLLVFLACLPVQSLLQPSFNRYSLGSSRTSSPLVVLHGRFGGSSFEPQDEDDDDYARRLAQAEAAIVDAKKARQELVRSRGPRRIEPPLNSRCTISRSDAGTLLIELPPQGVNTNVVLNGAFSLAWFSAIVPVTLAGGAPLLFMLPFWAAGGLVAKNAVVDPFISSQLSIGKFAWSLQSKYAGQVVQKEEGPTEQLKGANAETVAVVNGVPQSELRLYSTKGVVGLGLGLSGDELEYLAAEINEHLSTIEELSEDEM